MNGPLQVWVEGIGAWMPGLADWSAWRAFLRGEGTHDMDAPAKPRPASIVAGERRRMSLHVLAAIEVADQAVAMSGREGTDLASLFACAHGDVGIMDYMCAVLAETPQHLSPTRFHNSVHNAAAGYWTIASSCHAPSQAVTAADHSFAAGLLEAAVQATVEDRPLLLVAHDEPGSGPLAEVLTVAEPFACALVLSPHASDRAIARLDLSLGTTAADMAMPQHVYAAKLAQSNPAARGLAVLERLAGNVPSGPLMLTAAPHLGLVIDVHAPV